MRYLISYRREDSQGLADRLYERMVTAFGKADVYKDVDSIPPGEDFAAHIAASIAKADIMLVLIGDRWLDAGKSDGQAKIWRKGDVVRFEIETALLQDKRIVPILVGNASMPTEDELPPSIKRLRAFNAIRVRYDPDFRQDAARLVRHLLNLKTPLQRALTRFKRAALPLLIIASLAIGTAFLLSQLGKSNTASAADNGKSLLEHGPRSMDQTLLFGAQTTIEGKFYFQKCYTDHTDPTYKGRTASLPIILSDRLMVFTFSNLDKGFLTGEPPGPSDRIELFFTDGAAKDAHEKAIGKRGRVWGAVVMDNENRLLPVKFRVDRLEVIE